MGSGSFPGVKRPDRGFNHVPPSSARVKGTVELPSTPPLCFPGLLWAELEFRATPTYTHNYIYHQRCMAWHFLQDKNLLSLSGIEHIPSVVQHAAKSLHWLSYPGSWLAQTTKIILSSVTDNVCLCRRKWNLATFRMNMKPPSSGWL